MLNCLTYVQRIVRIVIFSSKLKEERDSIFYLNPCLDKMGFQEFGFSSKLVVKQTERREEKGIAF